MTHGLAVDKKYQIWQLDENDNLNIVDVDPEDVPESEAGGAFHGRPPLRNGRKSSKAGSHKNNKMLRRVKRIFILAVILAAVILVITLIGIHRSWQDLVAESLTVEAGSEAPAAVDFLSEKGQESKRTADPAEVALVTDLSGIDFSHVGEYPVTILIGDKKEYDSELVVEDTVAPTATALDFSINHGDELEAEDVVADIEDATDVSCVWKTEPDLDTEGEVDGTVLLTDEGGNTTELTSHITVIVDTEPPVIEGVMTISAFLGDPISYKSGITVTDNTDEEVELEVDTSQVDTETPGTYEITYTATDGAGNSSSASTYITISEKPEENVDEDTVLEMAQEVLDDITTEDMTKKQMAWAIYNWCRNNIAYVDTSDKDSWTNGAYQGFTKRSGDCFIYFSTAKALLTAAGIPNLDVVKSDTHYSSHYWSLVDVGDGWYHFDATPRKGDDDYFFLLTDDELEEYSSKHYNSHIFDHSLYPATPTEDSTVE